MAPLVRKRALKRVHALRWLMGVLCLLQIQVILWTGSKPYSQRFSVSLFLLKYMDNHRLLFKGRRKEKERKKNTVKSSSVLFFSDKYMYPRTLTTVRLRRNNDEEGRNGLGARFLNMFSGGRVYHRSYFLVFRGGPKLLIVYKKIRLRKRKKTGRT